MRGAVNLPHGTGKTVKVCVFTDGEAVDIANSAGTLSPPQSSAVILDSQGQVRNARSRFFCDGLEREGRMLITTIHQKQADRGAESRVSLAGNAMLRMGG